MTRTTFSDEIQDGETHRIEAPTEVELDVATERYVASLEGGQRSRRGEGAAASRCRSAEMSTVETKSLL